jgi:group I intron endonuclease
MMTDDTSKQDNRIHYLYRITNKINGKIYIGQTVQPEKRWTQHKTSAATDTPKMIVSYAIKKYGNDAFEFEVIAGCKTWDDANETETLLVTQYNSRVPNGYNVSLGGMNAPKTEAWKQMMRDHWADPEWKTRTAKAISEAHQSRTPEEKAEHSAKLVAAQSQWTEEFKIDRNRRIAQSLVGIPHTEERKEHQRGPRPNFTPWNKGTKKSKPPKLPKPTPDPKPPKPPKPNAGRFKPGHISWLAGTHITNSGSFKQGSQHSGATVNEQQVLQILKLHEQKIKKAEIARQLNIKVDTVYKILQGKVWSHITGIKNSSN